MKYASVTALSDDRPFVQHWFKAAVSLSKKVLTVFNPKWKSFLKYYYLIEYAPFY